MERSSAWTGHCPRTPSDARRRRRLHDGAAIVEVVIALPILIAIILTAIQFGLIYQAKAALNHATLQAARAGAVENANPDAIRRGLARGIAPLYSPESSLGDVIATIARINGELATDARIRILNPTREAFADFGEDVNGVREIPNDRLHARSTAQGAQSGVNVQDANILRVQITYGYELKAPLVNWFITRTLLAARGARSMDAFEQQLLRRTRLPMTATATVRMQTPARLSALVVPRSDLPDVDRFDARTRPPEGESADEEPTPDEDGDSSAGNDEGSSLGEGFLGFGGGAGDGAGGGETPETGGGSGGGGSGNSGGGNSGNPQQCNVDRPTPSPFPFPTSPPGDSSPITPAPGPGDLQLGRIERWSGSSATLPSIGLPSLAVGNPIHVATGNKYQAEIDIAAPPGALSVEFVRHYNSDSGARAGVLGAGWRHSYDAKLSFAVKDGQRTGDGEGASVLHVVQADGRELRFVRQRNAPDRYLAQRASDGELVVTRGGASFDPSRCIDPAQCVSYRWRWVSGREIAFDAGGRLRSIHEQGATASLHYNDAEQLTRVVDNQRRVIEFTYYRNGRIASVRASWGAKMHYRYDAFGNLEYAMDQDGLVRRYHYEDSRFTHHLTGVSAGTATPSAYGERSKFVRLATWAYDALGRGVLSTHANDAGKVTLSYGEQHTDVTDAFGRTTRYVIERRDGVALVTDVRGPGCGACGSEGAAYEFNEHFQITRVTANARPSLRFAYDSRQRLTRTLRIVGKEVAQLARYIYEGDARQPSRIELPSVNPEGVHSIQVQYRDGALPTSFIEQGYRPKLDGGYDRIERRYRMDYDEVGRIELIDGPRRDVDDFTRFEYDRFGRLVVIARPDGLERRVLAHDAGGRPTRIHGSKGSVTEVEYDVSGRVVQISQPHARGKRTVSYRYDALGRLEEIQGSHGLTEKLSYDGAERVNGRRSFAQGEIAQAMVFSADGQLEKTAVIAGAGELLRILHFAYDAERRLTEVRDGEGPPLQQLFYDDADRRPDRIVNALGATTSLAYDLLGQLTSIATADGGVVRFAYDFMGRLIRIESSNDAGVRYEYDDFGRRVREVSADRGVTHYGYDQAGNLIEKVDARGEVIRFTYSAAQQLESVRTREGETRFSYRRGRLVRVEGPWGAESLEYDADGNISGRTRELADHRFITAYRYDASGRVTDRKLPSGEWLAHAYDERGALMRIVRSQLFRTRTLLGGAGSPGALHPLGRIAYGNGLKLATRFDANGRLSTRTFDQLGTTRYELDDADRITGVARNDHSISYEYDALNRLTAARTPRYGLRYDYDLNGNRTRVHREELGQARYDLTRTSYLAARETDTSAEATYRYAPHSNRLVSDGSNAPITYDAAGHPIEVGERRYEYDSFGRPVKLYIEGSLAAEYAYNIWGERTRKTVYANGVASMAFYVYEQHRLVAEADDRGRITREYVYLDHHPTVMIDRGVPYWIHTDHLGAPIAVTDSDRRIVWRADYEPFGLARVDEDPDADGRKLTLNLRFPGQYADRESGTYYNLMRDYDPSTGRYLTPDPLGAMAGVNTYAYAHGNPVHSFDSLGLYDEMVHYYMTYFLAIVAGLPQDVARTIAIAAQYVDENSLTSPVNWGFIPNRRALPLYHFVMSDQGPLYGDRGTDPLNRFYDPASPQLSNLLASADPATLLRLWQEVNPDGHACPAPWVINDARYQLYGEFLHTYQDTFAHRDILNVPYGVRPNSDNTPAAFYGGHTGLGDANPLNFEPPDRTYNQDYRDDPSECVIGDSVSNRRVIFGLTESECRDRWRGEYTPPQTNEWAFNELRTLRMEYEIFDMLGRTFQEEIAANRERYQDVDFTLPDVNWRALAGRLWDDRDPEANARVGQQLTYEEWRTEQMLPEANTVLQRYNASSANEEMRLSILNEWLRANGFRDTNGDTLRIESWRAVEPTGARNRDMNIGWISAGSLRGLLLPSDA